MNNHSQRPVAQRSARGITAVLLLGLASPLLAGPPGMGGMRGGFGGDMFRMERLAQGLDLDDYQRDRLEQIGESARERVRPLVRELLEGRQALREAAQREQALSWLREGRTGPQGQRRIDVSQAMWADRYASAHAVMEPEALAALADDVGLRHAHVGR